MKELKPPDGWVLWKGHDIQMNQEVLIRFGEDNWKPGRVAGIVQDEPVVMVFLSPGYIQAHKSVLAVRKEENADGSDRSSQ